MDGHGQWDINGAIDESSRSDVSSSQVGSFHIETWGCQMNVHDSEKLAGAMELAGYTRAAHGADADVFLLNTCAIRERATEKVFAELGRLREFKLERPHRVLGVCGCVGQLEGEAIFARAPWVDFVIGPRATASLPQLIQRLRGGDETARHVVDTEYRDDSIRFPFDAIRREGQGQGKAFVTIVEGCNHRCTYCVVPTTRGREICRPMDEILAEVRSLAKQGILEIEFLGQTVNAYRDAEGRMLADLLIAAAAIEGVERLRFTTSHPAQMTDRLIRAMAEARPKLCPYLHLPVQSGSDSVLRAMRRGYDRAGYLQRIEALRREMPDLRFGTDVIVGFPSESEADFQETLSLLELVGFETVYAYTYSTRPGTAALALGDPLTEERKLERLHELHARQNSAQLNSMRGWVGQAVTVLVEGPSKRDASRWTGRTPENRLVHFPGEARPGTLHRVRVTDATAFCLLGEGEGSAA